MHKQANIKFYPPLEEKINIFSHGIGFLLSFIATIALVIRAHEQGDFWATLWVAIFGVSAMILYGTSTLYHSTTTIHARYKWKVFDHAAIYLLIAGSYTPIAQITLKHSVGWTMFFTAWGIATIGIILKLFFTGRYTLLSTFMYILMGWVIVFAYRPLLDTLASRGLYWLLAGGVAYTIGALIYSIKKIPFNHAIFHLFVVAGTFCHFMTVYFYVLNF